MQLQEHTTRRAILRKGTGIGLVAAGFGLLGRDWLRDMQLPSRNVQSLPGKATTGAIAAHANQPPQQSPLREVSGSGDPGHLYLDGVAALNDWDTQAIQAEVGRFAPLGGGDTVIVRAGWRASDGGWSQTERDVVTLSGELFTESGALWQIRKGIEVPHAVAASVITNFDATRMSGEKIAAYATFKETAEQIKQDLSSVDVDPLRRQEYLAACSTFNEYTYEPNDLQLDDDIVRQDNRLMFPEHYFASIAAVLRNDREDLVGRYQKMPQHGYPYSPQVENIQNGIGGFLEFAETMLSPEGDSIDKNAMIGELDALFALPGPALEELGYQLNIDLQ